MSFKTKAVTKQFRGSVCCEWEGGGAVLTVGPVLSPGQMWERQHNTRLRARRPATAVMCSSELSNLPVNEDSAPNNG